MKENINEIVAYIRANVEARIKVEDVAKAFGYSKFHFSREFKKLTGFSANAFISSLKMEKSISLLVKNKNNVLCSHLNAGFLSSTTFTASFEKQTGVKPKKYQKQLLELFELLKKYEKLEFAEDAHYEHSVSLGCKEEVQNRDLFSKCIVNLHFPEGYRSGICFVGLFHAPIPNHRPIVGKAMVGSNLCILDRIPQGTFYLLACSIEKNSPIQKYFVLDDCLRAKVDRALDFPRDHLGVFDLEFRGPLPHDPPITVNLPKLLAIKKEKGKERNV